MTQGVQPEGEMPEGRTAGPHDPSLCLRVPFKLQAFQTGLVLVPCVLYSQATLCCLILTLFHPLWPYLWTIMSLMVLDACKTPSTGTFRHVP